MLKKILILMFLSLGFLFSNNVFAEGGTSYSNWSSYNTSSSNWNSTSKTELEQRNEHCDKTWNCIDRSSFKINTDNFSLGKNNLKWTNWTQTINNTFWVIIQQLMIILWTLSLVVISIWAWFMMLFHWDDSTLTKWKNTIKWWIIALVVALSSYYIINMVWYILYK